VEKVFAMEEQKMISLLTGNWIAPFLFTSASVYILLIVLFKASTLQKNKFIIGYVMIVFIFDAILILNREKVSPDIFKGLSMGLLMGMIFAILRKGKKTSNERNEGYSTYLLGFPSQK
jgi:hypothetical protein